MNDNLDRVVIYVDMVADLFHSGHICFLEKIKGIYPNCLIYVGLMSDEQATNYKRRPILDINHRTVMVTNCRLVDRVFPNAPMPVTRNFLVENKIDLVFHGDDITEQSKNYWYKEALEMGIFKEIPYTSGISTSEIISRILDLSKKNST